MKNRRRFFGAGLFINSHGPELFLLFFLVALFLIVFHLYEIKTEAVAYAFGLWLLAAVPIGFVRVVQALRRRAIYRAMAKALPESVEELPDPRSAVEWEMQEMMRKLVMQLKSEQFRAEQERREELEYYTTWAHQIKTPISVIRLMLQELDTSENHALGLELFRIEQYVAMALDFFRLDSATHDFVIRSISLDSVIRQAIRKTAGLFIHKKLYLDYEPTEEVVLTDEKWLLFIIEQLVTNAVKYTEQGGVRIRVFPGKRLEIQDTGMGIAPEDLPRIFEKSYTGYNGRREKRATGIGLYLCMKACDRLSHRLSVRSDLGKGTTFCLELAHESIEFE